MYYFSACNRDLFKRYYCYVFTIAVEKSFKYYEKYFYFHLYIFLKKGFFVKKYKKEICYKENKSLFF